MAENPYLPSNLQQIGMLLSSLGAGVSGAGAQGRPFWAGIAPGAMMFGQAQARTQRNAMEQMQQDEARKLREQQLGMQQQGLDLKKAEAERRAGLGQSITSMLTGGTPGMGVRPGAPTMGPQDLSSIGEGIARVESGGNYQATGPETGRGRALGKYQVMDFNVGPWTQEALGQPLTPEQFLASPEAQEAVFRHKMGEYVAKYGPEGARRAWFAGEGGMNNPNASDVNGMTVARYAAATAPQGQPSPVVPTQGIAALDPAVRQTIAQVAQYDPEKAAGMLNSALQDQAKQGAWAPLSPGSAQMILGPGYDPAKAYQRNRRTGEIKPVGGSGVTVNVGGEKLLPGQKKVDEKFADQYVEFVTSGGFADSTKMLKQLQDVEAALKSGANLTGPLIGMQGDTMLSFTNPEAMAMRDAVFEVAQRNLRLVLGAQFTQKEGEALIARVYNPRLSETENAKRVRRLLDQIETAMETKIDSARYFEEHGTLRGWKGKLPRMSDFEPAPLPKETKPPTDRPPLETFERKRQSVAPPPADRPPLSSFQR